MSGRNTKWLDWRFVRPLVDNGRRIRDVWHRILPDSMKLTWFEQVWMTLLLVLRVASPSEHLKWWFCPNDGVASFPKKQFIDAYAVAGFTGLLAIVLWASPTGGWAVLVAILLVDTVEATLYAQFVRDYDKEDTLHSPNRSIGLRFVAYGNLIAGFATLYLWTGGISVGTEPTCGNTLYLQSRLDALYFSCVTITTLGYGDFQPTCGWSKIFVMVQTLSGFLLLALMLGVFVGMLGRNGVGKGNKNANRPPRNRVR